MLLYIMHELIDCCYIVYGMELCPDYTHSCIGVIDLSMLLPGEANSELVGSKRVNEPLDIARLNKGDFFSVFVHGWDAE